MNTFGAPLAGAQFEVAPGSCSAGAPASSPTNAIALYETWTAHDGSSKVLGTMPTGFSTVTCAVTTGTGSVSTGTVRTAGPNGVTSFYINLTAAEVGSGDVEVWVNKVGTRHCGPLASQSAAQPLARTGTASPGIAILATGFAVVVGATLTGKRRPAGVGEGLGAGDFCATSERTSQLHRAPGWQPFSPARRW